MKQASEIRLDEVAIKKGTFLLRADGVFSPGIHLLTGRVGSGKSTLGELLAGIEKPDNGRIEWGGTRRVMLFQDTMYHISTMTVKEEAASWHYHTDKILKLADLVGKEDGDLFSLSRGELKRLELAAILTGGFDLIILDEPYAGLDTDARQWVSHVIAEQKNQVIILISHDITSLPPIDMLWEMEGGVLHLIGPVPEGLQSWSRAPRLIRYLLNQGVCPTGLSRIDLEEAVCRIRG